MFPVPYSRLGNHLFQVAALLAHCAQNDLQPRIVIAAVDAWRTRRYYDEFMPATRPLMRDSFEDVEGTSPSDGRGRQAFPLPRVSSHDQPHAYTPIPRDVAILAGYFQSAKYFSAHAAHIRAMFQPHERVAEAVRKRHGAMLASCTADTTVVVHVRRGDYADIAHRNTLTPAYFRRGLEEVRSRMPTPSVLQNVLFFSDDIAWCREAFKDVSGARCVDESDECVALHLMSKFKHYVLSNSTFAWWAVVLGEPAGHVVAPTPWLTSVEPAFYEDVYMPEWIRLQAE